MARPPHPRRRASDRYLIHVRENWYRDVWLLAISVVTVIALLSAQSLATHNCRQVELIKTRIRTVITQSDESLGRPGSPGYGYYRAHRSELGPAHRANQRTLEVFRASRC